MINLILSYSFSIIGPGAMVVIRPNGITDYMHGIDPLMHLPTPLIPIKNNFVVPNIPISKDAESFTGFNLQGVHAMLSNTFVMNTPCAGHTCDKQGLVKNGKCVAKCSCIQGVNRTSTVVFCFTLKITTREGEEIVVRDFASDWWTKTFVLENGVPLGYRFDANDYDLMEEIESNANMVLAEGNNAGGWDALGWAKWGYVIDQAVAPDSNAPLNASSNEGKVKSGTLTHHVVSLLPSDPTRLNPVTMNGHMVNLHTRE